MYDIIETEGRLHASIREKKCHDIIYDDIFVCELYVNMCIAFVSAAEKQKSPERDFFAPHTADSVNRCFRLKLI